MEGCGLILFTTIIQKGNNAAKHASSSLRQPNAYSHVYERIKCLFCTLVHVCPYQVETKSAGLFNEVEQRQSD